MALKQGDRVRETSTTTGTGAMSLAGAPSGYRTFSSVLSDGDTCTYAIALDADWEVGVGTYNSTGNTLTRTTVTASSNAGAAVNWGAGSKSIFISPLASDPAFSEELRVPAGSVSSAAVQGNDDPNSGVYFPAADTVAVTVGGTQALKVETTAITAASPLVVPAGSTSSAAVQTSGDANSGLYFPAADTVAITTGGAQSLKVESTLLTSASPIVVPAGSTSSASIQASGDANSGIYFPASDTVSVVTGGTEAIKAEATAVTTSAPVVLPAGTAGAPALTTTGDLNTGVVFSAADTVGISTGGTQRLTIDTAAVTSTLPAVIPAGAVGAPSLAASDDLNTGAWFPAADTLALSTGGTEALRITSAQDVIVGNGDTNASPASRTLRGTDATGSDVAAGNLTLRPGLATGNAASGALIVQTGPAVASGSTLQTATERMRVNAAGEIVLGNGESSASPSSSTIRGTDATGSNVSGGSIDIRAGTSTGSASGASIRLLTSLPSTSGSSAQTQTERMNVDSYGRVSIGEAMATSSLYTGIRKIPTFTEKSIGALFASVTAISATAAGVSTPNVQDIIYAESIDTYLFVTNGAATTFSYSTNGGVTWTASGTVASKSYAAAAWSPTLSLFVVIDSTSTANTQRVLTSPTGATWTARTTPDLRWQSVAWIPELAIFIAGSSTGTGTRIMTSTNGTSWTLRNTPNDFQFMGYAYSSTLRRLVAVSTGGTIYSDDGGATWSTGSTAAASQLSNVIWSDELRLFIGRTTAQISTSPDGITWTQRLISAGNVGDVMSIPEFGVVVTAPYNGNGRYSRDGITWTAFSVGTTNGATGAAQNINRAYWIQGKGRIFGWDTVASKGYLYLSQYDYEAPISSWSSASGTNKPGSSLSFFAGRSTGNAYGGSFNFYSAAAGTSGTAVNAYKNILSVGSNSKSSSIVLGNGGISFPATAIGSTDSNTLDDYEEGTWTPSLVDVGGSSYSYAVRTGTYTFIGRIVLVSFEIQLATSGNTLNAAALIIQGLPVTPIYSNKFTCAVYFSNLATTTTSIVGVVVGDTSTGITLYRTGAAAASMSVMNSNNLSPSLGSVLWGSVFYIP